MNSLLLSDINREIVRDGKTWQVLGQTGERRGAFVVIPEGNIGIGRLTAEHPGLGGLLAAHGARLALHEGGLEKIVVRAPEQDIAEMLADAGFAVRGAAMELPMNLGQMSRNTRLVVAGGVEIGKRILSAMIGRGVRPVLALGYNDSLRHRSGYADLAPLCRDYEIPLATTRDINEPEIIERVRRAEPDYLLVLGWSQLFNDELLSIPRAGCLGLHPTRLPEGRGRAPIPWTLIKGLTESATSMFWLAAAADRGELADQRPFAITDADDAKTLYDKISVLQIEQMEEVLPRLLVRRVPRVPQNESRASHWPRRRPEDGLIDWRKSPRELFNWIRGLTAPYPGAFTFLEGTKVIIWKASPTSEPAPAGLAGEIIGGRVPEADPPDGAILIRTGGGGLLVVRRLQIGKEATISAGEWWRRGIWQTGMRFDV